MVRQAIGALLVFSIAGSILGLSAVAAETNASRSTSIIHRITSANERQQMVVNTSRILKLERKIPQAQVNNPEILDLTPLSPTDIQLAAKKAGVTQVNLWDEDNNIFTVDVVVYGDTRELEMILTEQFPNASLKLRGFADSVLISGFVENANDVTSIVRIAETFYPNRVTTRLQVGGVQQVLLHVKVMEVSRTKLRDLGFDWAYISGSNVVASAAAGLLTDAVAATGTDPSSVTASGGNFRFNVVNGPSTFFGILEAMRRDNFAKILAEPTLVTVSGRPASFQSGGKVPVVNGGGLGVPANTQYVEYGTKVDFVPIVLGNSRIRLEVRPDVTEIDGARSVGGQYAFRSRYVDTGVELQAGQTLAIAGLIQTRIESSRQGLPWVSELPYVGAAFRRTREERNEVELLILVTPELVAGMHADQVPKCGPGMKTTSPDDWELYFKGYLEVPNCCPSCDGEGCAECQEMAGGENLPTMLDSGEGQVIEMHEIPTPGSSEPPTPKPLPQKPAPETVPTAPQVPPAASSVGPQKPGPVGPAETPEPMTLPVSTAALRTSKLPGLIGPIGYDSGQ